MCYGWAVFQTLFKLWTRATKKRLQPNKVYRDCRTSFVRYCYPFLVEYRAKLRIANLALTASPYSDYSVLTEITEFILCN